MSPVLLSAADKHQIYRNWNELPEALTQHFLLEDPSAINPVKLPPGMLLLTQMEMIGDFDFENALLPGPEGHVAPTQSKILHKLVHRVDINGLRLILKGVWAVVSPRPT
jgi:hypothetical protein